MRRSRGHEQSGSESSGDQAAKSTHQPQFKRRRRKGVLVMVVVANTTRKSLFKRMEGPGQVSLTTMAVILLFTTALYLFVGATTSSKTPPAVQVQSSRSAPIVTNGGGRSSVSRLNATATTSQQQQQKQHRNSSMINGTKVAALPASASPETATSACLGLANHDKQELKGDTNQQSDRIKRSQASSDQVVSSRGGGGNEMREAETSSAAVEEAAQVDETAGDGSTPNRLEDSTLSSSSASSAPSLLSSSFSSPPTPPLISRPSSGSSSAIQVRAPEHQVAGEHGSSLQEQVAATSSVSSTSANSSSDTTLLSKQQQIQAQAFQRRLMELKQKYMTNRAISDRAYYILLVIYSLFIVVGTISNSLICLTVILKPKILSPRNIFIVNLAGSDLLLCVFTMPFSFIEISMKMWQMGLIPCKLVAGLQATSIFVSTISITAIALDRYKVIVYPTHQETASGTRSAALLLASVWIGALLLSLPLFRFRTVEHLDLPHKYAIKSIDFCIEAWPFAHGRGIYSVISMMFQYVLPITIVSVVYAKISDKLQKRLIRRQRLTQLECQQKRQLSLIKRTHIMLVSVSLIFGLSWLPLNLLNVIGDFSDLFKGDDQLFRIVFAICHLIGCSSACSNPILYGYLNENFRKEFHQVYTHHMHRLMRCCCRFRLCGRSRGGTYLPPTPSSTIVASSSSSSSTTSSSSNSSSSNGSQPSKGSSNDGGQSISYNSNNIRQQQQQQRTFESSTSSLLLAKVNTNGGGGGGHNHHLSPDACVLDLRLCGDEENKNAEMVVGANDDDGADREAKVDEAGNISNGNRRNSFQTMASGSRQTLGRTMRFCLCVSGSSSIETLGGGAFGGCNQQQQSNTKDGARPPNLASSKMPFQLQQVVANNGNGNSNGNGKAMATAKSVGQQRDELAKDELEMQDIQEHCRQKELRNRKQQQQHSDQPNSKQRHKRKSKGRHKSKGSSRCECQCHTRGGDNSGERRTSSNVNNRQLLNNNNSADSQQQQQQQQSTADSNGAAKKGSHHLQTFTNMSGSRCTTTRDEQISASSRAGRRVLLRFFPSIERYCKAEPSTLVPLSGTKLPEEVEQFAAAGSEKQPPFNQQEQNLSDEAKFIISTGDNNNKPQTSSRIWWWSNTNTAAAEQVTAAESKNSRLPRGSSSRHCANCKQSARYERRKRKELKGGGGKGAGVVGARSGGKGRQQRTAAGLRAFAQSVAATATGAAVDRRAISTHRQSSQSVHLHCGGQIEGLKMRSLATNSDRDLNVASSNGDDKDGMTQTNAATITVSKTTATDNNNKQRADRHKITAGTYYLSVETARSDNRGRTGKRGSDMSTSKDESTSLVLLTNVTDFESSIGAPQADEGGGVANGQVGVGDTGTVAVAEADSSFSAIRRQQSFGGSGTEINKRQRSTIADNNKQQMSNDLVVVVGSNSAQTSYATASGTTSTNIHLNQHHQLPGIGQISAGATNASSLAKVPSAGVIISSTTTNDSEIVAADNNNDIGKRLGNDNMATTAVDIQLRWQQQQQQYNNKIEANRAGDTTKQSHRSTTAQPPLGVGSGVKCAGLQCAATTTTSATDSNSSSYICLHSHSSSCTCSSSSSCNHLNETTRVNEVHNSIGSNSVRSQTVPSSLAALAGSIFQLSTSGNSNANEGGGASTTCEANSSCSATSASTDTTSNSLSEFICSSGVPSPPSSGSVSLKSSASLEVARVMANHQGSHGPPNHPVSPFEPIVPLGGGAGDGLAGGGDIVDLTRKMSSASTGSQAKSDHLATKNEISLQLSRHNNCNGFINNTTCQQQQSGANSQT